MTGLFIVVHALVCIVLIVIVLAQSGRGGGLTESFAAAESVFGAKTNEFMVRATAIAGTIFLITSLSLAYLSSRTEHSIMADQIIEDLPEIAQEIETLPEIPEEVTSPEEQPLDGLNQPIKTMTGQETVQ